MGRNAQSLSGQVQPGAQPFKSGGKVHSDIREDKAMVKKMVKPAALKGGKGVCCAKVGKKK